MNDKERKTSDTRETVNDKERRRQRAQSRDIRLTFMVKGSGQPENLAASRKGEKSARAGRKSQTIHVF